MTTTSCPVSAASRAAVAPAMPQPMTRMSARMSRSLMAASTDEIHADVDGPGRVGQGSDGDVVDAGLGDGPDAVEGHVAGGLEGDAAAHEVDRLAHGLDRHVVEHDHVGARGQRLADLE